MTPHYIYPWYILNGFEESAEIITVTVQEGAKVTDIWQPIVGVKHVKVLVGINGQIELFLGAPHGGVLVVEHIHRSVESLHRLVDSGRCHQGTIATSTNRVGNRTRSGCRIDLN